MSDITDAGPRLAAMNDALEEIDRLRKREAELLAAGDRLESQLCDAARERDRLRLTDAEREAVERIAHWCEVDGGYCVDEGDQRAANHYAAHAATLRGLLERFSQFAKREPYRLQPIEHTPASHATPGECTVSPQWTSRPYWVDPPSGWRYGFPRLYHPAKDGDMRAWMIRHGYPEHLANQGLACTFTAQTEGVG